MFHNANFYTMQCCPKCSSTNIRYRPSRHNWICDDCDCVFTDDKIKQEQNNKNISKRIFLSYGHDYSDLVLKVKNDLENLGYEVWIDVCEIKSGYDWRQTITEGILNSQVVLAFLSKFSLRQGGVCLDELAIAVGCNRNIIRTCLLEKDAIELIPATINGIQYIDATECGNGSITEDYYRIKFKEIIESIDNISLDKDPILAELEIRLQPNIQFSEKLYELRKRYYQRSWLNNAINMWIQERKERNIFIIGYPGSGKSCFCINNFHYHPMAISLTICDNSFNNSLGSKQLLKNIAYQIAIKVESYRKNLLWTINHHYHDFHQMTFSELFRLMLCVPFQLEINGNHSPMIIVVDGLDKLSDNATNEFVEVFNELSKFLPPFIHFLFTARHLKEVVNSISQTQFIYIEPNSKETYYDIRNFLKSELDNATNIQLNAVTKRCCGSFLYATLFVESINSGMISIGEALSLRQELQSLYNQSMKKLFPSIEEYKNYIYPLSLIIGSNGKIPINSLIKYMKWRANELNIFYKHVMMFFQRTVDETGTMWISSVYPSFIAWITNDTDYTNEFYIPLISAQINIANEVWKSYCEDENMSDYELLNLFDFLHVAKQKEKINQLFSTNSFLVQIIDRINDLIKDYNNNDLASRLLAKCEFITSRIDNAISNQIQNSIIPYLQMYLCFVESNYSNVIALYERYALKIRQYCKKETSLNALFMAATSYDISGQRQKSTSLFVELMNEAINEKNTQYELFAAIGLLWNNHFNNINDGYKYVKRLESFTYDNLELANMQKLILARFKLSEGKLKESLNDFKYIMEGNNSFVWKYDIISTRNQMLLIEALVAYYDNMEYYNGISLGKKIFENINEDITINSCYCGSWIVMNMIQAGLLNEAEELLLYILEKNKLLQKLGTSDWMDMHLKSVQAFLLEQKGEIENAISAHKDVVRMAIKTNDSWVKGDAYFEIFCLWLLSGKSHEKQEEIYDLYMNLEALSKTSHLPHLSYKTLIIKCFISRNRNNVELLREKTINQVLTDSLPSTNSLLMLYLCILLCSDFGIKKDDLIDNFISRKRKLTINYPKVQHTYIYKMILSHEC